MPGVLSPEVGSTPNRDGYILRGLRDSWLFAIFGRLNHDIRCVEDEFSEGSAAAQSGRDDFTQERQESRVFCVRLPELGRLLDLQVGMGAQNRLESHLIPSRARACVRTRNRLTAAGDRFPPPTDRRSAASAADRRW